VVERRRSDIAELKRKLERWRPPALAPIRGTWLAEVDAALYLSDTARLLEADGTDIENPNPTPGRRGQSS
jgi:hypothetical protein